MQSFYIQCTIFDKDDRPKEWFEVLDFNVGTAFKSYVGQEFDDSRLSDPHVARSVIHFIKSQGMLIIAKKTDLVTVRLQSAFYEKKLFRTFNVNLVSRNLRLNPASPDLLRDQVAFEPGLGWGSRLLGTVTLRDVSITGFYTQDVGLNKFGVRGIDIITLAGKETGEVIPDWSDYYEPAA